jgi:drug/metabolite transporter (DMT)-like permease
MAHRLPNAGDYGLLLLLAAIWGSSFAFIKIGVTEVPPITLTAVRLGLAAAFLLLVLAVTRRAFPTGRALWSMMVASAFIGNALPFCLIAWGQQSILSGTAAILMGVMPLFTMVLAHAFTDDEKLNLRKVVGMAVGLFGLCVLVGPAALQGLTASFVGMLALLAAATCYGFNAVLIRRMDAPDRASAVTIIILLSALIVAPFAFVLEDPLVVTAGLKAWSAVMTLGVLHTAIATLLMFTIIGRAGASFFSQLNLIVPIAGVVWAAVLLSEIPGLNALAALGLIILGILIAKGGLALGTPGPVAEKGALKP